MKIDNKSDFISILKKNDPDSIRKFLLSNGKKPKPYCPFYFEKTEVDSNGGREHEILDEGNQRSNEETEGSK